MSRPPRKAIEQNMDIVFKSAVAALQNAYNEYKEEVINNIRCSFYNNDGVYSVQGDYKARQKQLGRVFKGIVVEYPERKGKPYFSIKYTENGQEFIGYGTCKPEVLSEYLKECFMPSAESEIIRRKDCKYNMADESAGNALCGNFYGMTDQYGYCHMAERRTDAESSSEQSDL